MLSRISLVIHALCSLTTCSVLSEWLHPHQPQTSAVSAVTLVSQVPGFPARVCLLACSAVLSGWFYPSERGAPHASVFIPRGAALRVRRQSVRTGAARSREKLPRVESYVQGGGLRRIHVDSTPKQGHISV